jgi:hypothetical protein
MTPSQKVQHWLLVSLLESGMETVGAGSTTMIHQR